MIMFLLEILFILAAPIAHITLCILRIAGRIRLSIVMITALCLLAGVILPVLASYIDIMNLPSDVKCATGSVGFALLGMFFTLAVIPASAVLFSIIVYYKRKKLDAAV